MTHLTSNPRFSGFWRASKPDASKYTDDARGLAYKVFSEKPGEHESCLMTGSVESASTRHGYTVKGVSKLSGKENEVLKIGVGAKGLEVYCAPSVDSFVRQSLEGKGYQLEEIS